MRQITRDSTRLRLATLALASAWLTACATASNVPNGTQTDRILAVDNGKVLHSTSDENDRATIPAPVAKVWPALVASYADLGISPTVDDEANGRYGNAGFVLKTLKGRAAMDYFSCGSGLTGALTGSGRVIVNMVSQIGAAPTGETAMVTHVSAKYRSNDGASSAPLDCGSTGLLEKLLRNAVTLRAAGGAP
jgi:hypothetical protein